MPVPSPAAKTVPRKSPPPRPASLARHLALFYTVLVAYASLHPLTGWRDPGISPFYFLDAAWPRYWTLFDLATNVVAYLPLGFLIGLSLPRLPGRWTSAFIAFLLGSLLSFCLESLQTWLPSRVASNLDLASNALGAGIGAMLSVWYGGRFFVRIALLQRQLLAPIPHSDFGLALIGLWLLTQLSPETVLFGAGDLRHLFEIPPAVPYAARSFFALETAVIVCNTIAVGLTARALLADRSSHFFALTFLFAVALSIRSLAAAVLVNPVNAFAWLTPGAALGLLLGGLLLSILLLLPASLRIAMAGLALMAGTVLVNITPPNPYSAAALAAWRQGHFLNFNGVTRLAASFWPFLALPFLTALGRRIDSNQG